MKYANIRLSRNSQKIYFDYDGDISREYESDNRFELVGFIHTLKKKGYEITFKGSDL